MYSVILTELGIAVFENERCLKTFPFLEPVEDDGAKIQSSKPKILQAAGFAEDEDDAMAKLREFAIALSSSKVSEVSQSPDLHIIQTINSLDESDKISNAMSSRLREWYGLHFPELDNK